MDGFVRPFNCMKVGFIYCVGRILWLSVPWRAYYYRYFSFIFYIIYCISSYWVAWEPNMAIICWVIACCCIMNCFIISINKIFSEGIIVCLFVGAVFSGTC